MNVTKHARQRMASRRIPADVLDLVVSYGEARKARDGAQKLALSKRSLLAIKQELGGDTARRLARFRRVCVVEASDTIVTALWATRPLLQ